MNRTELGGAALGLLGGAILASEGAFRASPFPPPPDSLMTPAFSPPPPPPMTGAAVAAAAAIESSSQPHLVGDLMALTAAAAFAGYLSVGQKLRKWMPLFVYAAPVTGVKHQGGRCGLPWRQVPSSHGDAGIAALSLTIVSAAVDLRDAELAGIQWGVIGWMFHSK